MHVLYFACMLSRATHANQAQGTTTTAQSVSRPARFLVSCLSSSSVPPKIQSSGTKLRSLHASLLISHERFLFGNTLCCLSRTKSPVSRYERTLTDSAGASSRCRLCKPKKRPRKPERTLETKEPKIRSRLSAGPRHFCCCDSGTSRSWQPDKKPALPSSIEKFFHGPMTFIVLSCLRRRHRAGTRSPGLRVRCLAFFATI